MSLLHEVGQSSYKNAINKIAKKTDEIESLLPKYSVVDIIQTDICYVEYSIRAWESGIALFNYDLEYRNGDGYVVIPTLQYLFNFDSRLDLVGWQCICYNGSDYVSTSVSFLNNNDEDISGEIYMRLSIIVLKKE